MRIARFSAALVVLLAGLGFFADVNAQKGSKAPRIARLTIPSDPGLRVFSDGASYTDYRSVSATAGDACVDIAAESTFVRLNRPIEVSGSESQNCTYPDPPQRQFWLQFDNAEACAHFDPDTNPYADWRDSTRTTCMVSGHERPRIRALDVFKNRVSKIPVAFLILNYDGSYSFEVRTTVDARVTANGETRTVTNNNDVTLWKFHPFPQDPTPEVTFAMPFVLVFERLPG